MNTSEDKAIFSSEEIAQCDEIALKYLFLEEKEVPRKRRLVPELHSILYREAGQMGGSLFVCLDGSLLFADNIVGRKLHRAAFEQGLRTDVRMLQERREELAEELFSTV